MPRNAIGSSGGGKMKGMRVLLVSAFLVLAATSNAIGQIDLGLPTVPKNTVDLPGSGLVKGAFLYAPEGPGPYPAIVLSHTCGGLRHHVFTWAARAIAAGYVALVIDHLGPRSLRNNCVPDIRVSVTEFAQDTVAGMKHLRTLPFVDGRKIALMGFSYGAMAALRAASASFRAKYLGGERFSAVVAMYPWCNEFAGRGGDHQFNFYDDTDIPLLLILGQDDDDSPPDSCIRQARANAEKGLPVTWRLYPKTTHAFDLSQLGDKPYRFWQGNKTVTYRYNANTVDEAWRESLALFARHLGPGKGG